MKNDRNVLQEKTEINQEKDTEKEWRPLYRLFTCFAYKTCDLTSCVAEQQQLKGHCDHLSVPMLNTLQLG